MTEDASESLLQLSERYGLDYLPAISDDMLDPSLVERLPLEWARTRVLLPIRYQGEVCVACDDPSRVSEQEDLALLIGEEMRPVVSPKEEILQAVERCYYRRDDSPSDFLRGLESLEGEAPPKASQTDDLLQAPEKAPVTQLINLILLQAVKRGASDIHFEPFESRLTVRYRIDGVLYEQASPPKHLEDALVSRLKVMGRLDIAEKRLPQDGMARVRVGEREIDIRVSTVPVAEGERVVLRLLDKASALLPLDVLGMSPDMMNSFAELTEQPNGMIVVSGPTGSGKTTTLYAALARLDAVRRNILTIEDPIEYQLPQIGQIQVKPKIGLTFSTGLRHILRQDPDIILVGETRDLETAEIAVRASLTGHLVLTTLHTNDAPGAILRLADMGVEPYLLAACIRGVLAQRLVRRLCPHCRQATYATPEDLRAAGDFGTRLAGEAIWEAVGCDACLEGYSGRSGLFELMTVDAEAQERIRAGSFDLRDLHELARRKGMAGLFADGIDKVLAGVTSLAEVINVAAR